MKPENRQIFEENRKHYDTLVNAGYMVHLSGRDRSNLVKAMSEEFQPGYSADLWCPPCVANMMHQVYRRYLAFVEEEKAAARATVLANIPAIDLTVNPEMQKLADHIEADKKAIAELLTRNDPPPIQTKANFPSHKQNHRRR